MHGFYGYSNRGCSAYSRRGYSGFLPNSHYQNSHVCRCHQQEGQTCIEANETELEKKESEQLTLYEMEEPKPVKERELQNADLEQVILESMHKRLQQMEELLKERIESEIGKKVLEDININMSKMAKEIAGISVRLSRLES